MLDPTHVLVLVVSSSIPTTVAEPLNPDSNGRTEKTENPLQRIVRLDEDLEKKLKINKDALSKELKRYGLSPRVDKTWVRLQPNGSPLAIRGFDGLVITLPLEKVRALEPNWAD